VKSVKAIYFREVVNKRAARRQIKVFLVNCLQRRNIEKQARKKKYNGNTKIEFATESDVIKDTALSRNVPPILLEPGNRPKKESMLMKRASKPLSIIALESR
tara:strand:- start:24392 stop:24697 length:306 start_codon:yes stop_codon:yes gene_type:complete